VTWGESGSDFTLIHIKRECCNMAVWSQSHIIEERFNICLEILKNFWRLLGKQWLYANIGWELAKVLG
jgi:hypothetical protein